MKYELHWFACDECGQPSPQRPTVEMAGTMAKRAGWRVLGHDGAFAREGLPLVGSVQGRLLCRDCVDARLPRLEEPSP